MMEATLLTSDFRDVVIPRADLVLCDPPYGLGKNYNGEREQTSYAEWVNTLLPRTSAPWRLFFAPPLHHWSLDDLDEQPHRLLFWCKTFVQLRKTLKEWQYATTPILVYREKDAPWYGPTKAPEHFDWFHEASAIADVRVTKRYFEGKHPGVTATRAARRLIRATTQPGDLVVDPMSGIGSIPVAAIREDRRAWGCEIDPEYAEAGRRWVRGEGGLLVPAEAAA